MSIGMQDIETFFETLLLGDFVENQNTAGQVVGGLIALIPVLEQVMVARDVSGALFNINKHGGFAKAETTQVVNLGFAAFGAVPEVGEAFKTVFKPLWKERTAARGAVHGGLEAIESLLGMHKGGAIAWVREELLGKWSSRMQKAIDAANAALEVCIELTEFLATAQGWKNWLIPASTQVLASQLLPQLQGYKGTIDAPMNRAGNEIQEFLKDLLGEQVAAVVVAVGLHAAAASVMPGTRTRAGHNGADLPIKGHVPKREQPREIMKKNEASASHGAGTTHSEVQHTANALAEKLTQEIVGISGEHIADYICAYDDRFGWGTDWTGHDDGSKGIWTGGIPGIEKQGKLSHGGTPKLQHVLYKLHDGANGTGLDAVWRAEKNNGGKKYAVVEAKASRDEDAPKFHLSNSTRKPSIVGKLGVNGVLDASEILEPIEDVASAQANNTSSRIKKKKRGAAAPSEPTPAQQEQESARSQDIIVQMSRQWISLNLQKAVGQLRDDVYSSYSRHLFFTPQYHMSGSPAAHMLAKLEQLGQDKHAKHDGFHYSESEVKTAVNKKKAKLRAKHGNLPNLQAES